MFRASSRLSLSRKFGFPPMSTTVNANTRLIECSDAFYKSAAENLKENENPMTRTKYNKAFLKHMYDQAQVEQLPVVLKAEQISQRFAEANGESELRRRNVIYSEIVDGVQGEAAEIRLAHPAFLNVNSLNNFDGKPQHIRPEVRVYQEALSLSNVQQALQGGEVLFDYLLEKGDHFEKFAPKERPTDLLATLEKDQLLVNSLPNNFFLPSLIEVLKKKQIDCKKVQFKTGFSGRTASVLVTLSREKDLLAAKQAIESARFDSISPSCYSRLDSEECPVEARTVAISRISAEYDIDSIINKIDQVSPVLSAEYAMKYENPRLIQTDELLSILRDPEFFSEIPRYLHDRVVQIHEQGGDQFTVITLDSDYKPKKTETYSRLLHKTAFPEYYTSSLGTDEPINSTDPVIYRTIKVAAHSGRLQPEEPSRKKHSTKSMHQRRDLVRFARLPEDKSVHELRTLGESHLGYAFLTFGSPTEAKRALVLAQMAFNPFVYDADAPSFGLDLLKDDYHMDFDESFQVRQAVKVLQTETDMQAKIEELRVDLVQHEK